MEKRFLQFFIVTILFLTAYTYFISKLYPPQPTPPPSPGQSQEAILPPSEKDEIASIKISEAGAKLREIEFSDLVVTFSLTGGYIKSIYHSGFEEDLNFKNIALIPAHQETPFTLTKIDSSTVVLKAQDGIKKTFRFTRYSLQIGLEVPQADTQAVLFSNSFSNNSLDQRYQEIFYKSDPSSAIDRMSLRKVKTGSKKAVTLIGARDRYFCIAFSSNSFIVQFTKEEELVYVTTPLLSQETHLESYIGPQSAQELKEAGLSEVLSYGTFHPIAVVMLKMLRVFHKVTRNWGIGVILLSILIYLLLFPLTFKSSKDMKEMKEFQKIHKQEIEKVREKYKNQPEKVHQATLELYKKHGVNPLKGCSSGCLPLLFQLPIIIAFWNVVPRALEFKGASFLWIKDLSLPDRLFHLPVALPFLGEWINILPLLTAVLMLLQMRSTSIDMDPEQAQQQKMMSLMFPVMIGVFTYHFPSALLLYWFTNSILTFISQWKIMHPAAKAKAA